MTKLNTVSPRSFRLGGGREEPDGSFSFLVRFVGRDQGITGELFVRFEEQRLPPRPAEELTPESQAAAIEDEAADDDNFSGAKSDEGILAEQVEQFVEPEPKQAPPRIAAAPIVSGQKIWLFEDLILEEPRSRESENAESRNHFDFPPYERFF